MTKSWEKEFHNTGLSVGSLAKISERRELNIAKTRAAKVQRQGEDTDANKAVMKSARRDEKLRRKASTRSRRCCRLRGQGSLSYH